MAAMHIPVKKLATEKIFESLDSLADATLSQVQP